MSRMLTAPASRRHLHELTARGVIPPRVRDILDRFFDSYAAALSSAGMDPAAFDHLFCGFIERVAEQFVRPFAFEPFHRQITSPFDYYTFGVEFLRPLVDKTRSTVTGLPQLARLSAQLAARENVVLLANHQTEGDPQAISLLLEDSYPAVAREMIFVAGDRVTTDPLPVPFSMGRNLLCIYSRRYIDHPPEDRARKTAHNRKTMERMSDLLAEGGWCIYVAPSGGRDRRNSRGVIEVAPFDPQSVEMFRLMAERPLEGGGARPTHFYPMALKTYDFLPPPETVQTELGEARRATRTGLHLAVCPEVDLSACPGSERADKRERREARAGFIWQQVSDAYARFPNE
jgi:glycerol-3-phosphate O-acyltransferase